jgi:hypothetical protein
MSGKPVGEEETGGVRFYIDMIFLTGNIQNQAARSVHKRAFFSLT